jgi:hypothetical protein
MTKARTPVFDSIRGMLLILMTLDHLGGPIAGVLYGRLGFFSAAEGFFFLSGFIATRVALNKPDPARWFRARAFTIWSWHILSVLAVSFLVLVFHAQGFAPMPGLERLSEQPLPILAGAVAMIHLPDYLDVLPLYVLLMFFGNLVLLACLKLHASKARWLILGGSIALWGLGTAGLWSHVRSTLPSWMHPGTFDPLCWQLVFTAGALLASFLHDKHQQGEASPSISRRTFLLATVASLVFLAWKNSWLPLPIFGDDGLLASRSHLGILRIISFSAIAVVATYLLTHHPAWLTFRFSTLLGRHSLQVFTWHIPLVYLWLSRPWHGPTFLVIAVPLAIVASLSIPALIREH